MKVLGISGSPRNKETSGCYQLVKTVCENTGMDYEIISLSGKHIRACIACLGCVQNNVCVLKDDLPSLREKIVEADAYVFGGSNYYNRLNGLMHCLLERFYQFRHREGNTLWGKLAVAVGIGGSSGSVVTDEIEEIMAYNFIETVAKVSGQGAACCWTCGYGETCKVGAIHMLYGPDIKITEDKIPDVQKQPEILKAAENAGKLLGKRLNVDYDRGQITMKMQSLMMEKFKETT
jgi:multimeric flavodoxin WrbA